MVGLKIYKNKFFYHKQLASEMVNEHSRYNLRWVVDNSKDLEVYEFERSHAAVHILFICCVGKHIYLATQLSYIP